MNKRFSAALSAVMYFVSALAFFFLIGTDFTLFRFSHTEKFITAVLVFIFACGASALRCARADREIYRFRLTKRTITLLFFIYLVIVIDFTLIDDSFGRDISNIFTWNRDELINYINYHTNIVPFATVRLFIRGYRSGAVTLPVLAENIFGNLLVFMPFAFFVPVVFRRIRGFAKFIAAITLSVIMIELLQFVFRTGSSDIDDLILNVAGAAAAYGILKIKKVSRVVSRITFGVWCTNEK